MWADHFVVGRSMCLIKSVDTSQALCFVVCERSTVDRDGSVGRGSARTRLKGLLKSSRMETKLPSLLFNAFLVRRVCLVKLWDECFGKMAQSPFSRH